MAHHSVLLPGKSHGRRSLVGCSPWGRQESDTTERLHFHFHFHALEKEMATHSSVLAWRIPETGEPGGLPSMGSHRVGHDWSDLAAVRRMLFPSFLVRWTISTYSSNSNSFPLKACPVSLRQGSLLLTSVSLWIYLCLHGCCFSRCGLLEGRNLSLPGDHLA